MKRSEAASLAGLRILVVEDEYLVARDLQRILERAGAQVVGPAADSAAARDLLARSPVEAALLDIKLSCGSVFVVADELAASGVPLVFATGYDRDVLPERFQQACYVEKPLRAGRLEQAIGRAVAGDARGGD